MAESLAHVSYVRRMVSYVETIVPDFAQSLLYADIPDFPTRTPQVVGGYYPDLFYKSLNVLIIGEAKTDNDIDNEHTLAQLDSYIEETRTFLGQKHIILCSSILSFSMIKNMVIRKKRRESLSDVVFHVLDNYQNVAVI